MWTLAALMIRLPVPNTQPGPALRSRYRNRNVASPILTSRRLSAGSCRRPDSASSSLPRRFIVPTARRLRAVVVIVRGDVLGGPVEDGADDVHVLKELFRSDEIRLLRLA